MGSDAVAQGRHGFSVGQSEGVENGAMIASTHFDQAWCSRARPALRRREVDVLRLACAITSICLQPHALPCRRALQVVAGYCLAVGRLSSGGRYVGICGIRPIEHGS